MKQRHIGIKERIAWAKSNKNGWGHKILVILGLRRSPTLEQLHSFYGVDMRAAFIEGVKAAEKEQAVIFRYCEECAHYIITDSRTNWNGAPTTYIYGCEMQECKFRRKEGKE